MTADEQLAVRVHFLRCGGLLDDWSVEGVLNSDPLVPTPRTTQSERPVNEATRLADHPAFIMRMILLLSKPATAAHIVFENGVTACLPQLFCFVNDSAHSNKLC
ncbi:hypothetical protein TNCV_275201 [Trichonephila clavipes]|nr:hypothetical protein TNCV_275201 [Trichonephila clavipes]